jgi:hypothetical protein
MTEGYIVVNSEDPSESSYLIVPSNKNVETLSPYQGSLHILCVIRDVGDPVNDRLIKYLRDFIDKGLSALPSTYRQVWMEYKTWMENPQRLEPAVRSSKDPYRMKKYTRRIEPDDPNYQVVKICEICNRPVRLGLYTKKHKDICKSKKISNGKRGIILAEMGISFEQFKDGNTVLRTDLS